MPYWCHNDTGYLIPVLVDELLQSLTVIVVEVQRILIHLFGYPSMDFHTPVVPPMIAAADYLVALCVSACNADRAGRRIRSDLYDDSHLSAGNKLPKPLEKQVLPFLHKREAESLFHLLDDCLIDFRLYIADDDGAIGTEHINVIIAVLVNDMASFPLLDEDGIFSGHEIVRAPDAHYTARTEILCLFKEPHRLGEL